MASGLTSDVRRARLRASFSQGRSSLSVVPSAVRAAPTPLVPRLTAMIRVVKQSLQCTANNSDCQVYRLLSCISRRDAASAAAVAAVADIGWADSQPLARFSAPPPG